jgi:hypothetical protein
MSQTTLIIIACVIIFVVVPSFKDRAIPVKKLLIGPAIFVYLFYQSLGVVLGIIIGYLLRRSAQVVAIPTEKKIVLKGSFFTLYVFIAIFAVHFIVGYLKAVYPAIFAHVNFLNQMLLLMLALSSCITIGSNGCLFLKYLSVQNKTLF